MRHGRTIFLLMVIALGSVRADVTGNSEDEAAVRKVVGDYTDSWNRHDMQAFARVFTDNVDYVNIAGRHWKGVEQNVREHAVRFERSMKNAVQTPTGMQIRFLTPNVALIHTTWDLTGYIRPNGEKPPVLKEITTMVMTKSGEQWLITAFQNTELTAQSPDTK